MSIFSPQMEAIVFIVFHLFRNFAVLKFGVYINNSLRLARKYAPIFVLEHYLFLEAHSSPRAMLSENCSPLGTDNVQGQISEHTDRLSSVNKIFGGVSLSIS